MDALGFLILLVVVVYFLTRDSPRVADHN